MLSILIIVLFHKILNITCKFTYGYTLESNAGNDVKPFAAIRDNKYTCWNHGIQWRKYIMFLIISEN